MILCACAVAAWLAAQMPAQPDFTGRWVLIAPDPPPADVPAVLVVQQHVRRTDVRGNPMQPFWDSLTVRGNESKGAIRSGSYHVGGIGGTVGGLVGRDASGLLPPTPMTQESVNWEGGALVITSEKWMEREAGKRESYECHREVWAMAEQGRLRITTTDTNGESRTRTLTYQKERPGR